MVAKGVAKRASVLLYFCDGGCYGSLRSVGYPVQGEPFDGASELLEDRDDQQ